jgi:hypothetical protein
MLGAAELTHAYGLDAITFATPAGATVPGDGRGETIALIEAYHDPTLASDLAVFDQANGLPDPPLAVVDQAGTKTNDAWASEESLDVEWAHAIAPGAGILEVEARSQGITDLLAAVDVARSTPGVVAVSMSWGFAETPQETGYDAHFTTPAGHAGITFVAASGDSGPWNGPEYPASSPEVLAVGGTTLNLGDLGDYLGETAWTGSGGGYSQFEARPRYQRSVQGTGRRSTPDVAFDGDPATGVAVFQTPLEGGPGSWQLVGGTSLGAPAWAAMIAIADQGRALAGKGSLDGPTQTLPTLYALPATDFHTISLPAPESPWGGGVNPIGFFPLESGLLSLLHRNPPGTAAPGGRPRRQHGHRPGIPRRPVADRRLGRQHHRGPRAGREGRARVQARGVSPRSGHPQARPLQPDWPHCPARAGYRFARGRDRGSTQPAGRADSAGSLANRPQRTRDPGDRLLIRGIARDRRGSRVGPGRPGRTGFDSKKRDATLEPPGSRSRNIRQHSCRRLPMTGKSEGPALRQAIRSGAPPTDGARRR